MAEAAKSALADDIVKDKFLSCSICLEAFNNPKVLPCLHTFCLVCLESYIEKTTENGEFFCPCCRVVTKVPANGVAHFKSNFFINSLVDHFWGTQIEHFCAECSYQSKISPAVSKCMDCSDYLCSTCSGVHTQTRLTRNHSVISLTELFSQKNSNDTKLKTTLPCSEHPDENVRYYCTVCDKPVCRDCKALTHHEHNCVAFQDAIKKRKPILQEKIQRLTDKCQKIQLTTADLQGYRDDVEYEHQTFTEELERITQDLQKSVATLKSQALQDVQKRTDEALKANEVILNEFKTLSAQLTHQKDCLITTLERGADVEILDTFKMSSDHFESLCIDDTRLYNSENSTLRQYTLANEKNLKQFVEGFRKSFEKIERSLTNDPYLEIFADPPPPSASDRIYPPCAFPPPLARGRIALPLYPPRLQYPDTIRSQCDGPPSPYALIPENEFPLTDPSRCCTERTRKKKGEKKEIHKKKTNIYK